MNCADVGNLIRKLRTDLNMAQKQPADKLGGQRQGSLKMGERSFP
jgi:hypothetical protein